MILGSKDKGLQRQSFIFFGRYIKTEQQDVTALFFYINLINQGEVEKWNLITG